ncbi:unnamed protein product, partial [Phaeothamnion confervicola]
MSTMALTPSPRSPCTPSPRSGSFTDPPRKRPPDVLFHRGNVGSGADAVARLQSRRASTTTLNNLNENLTLKQSEARIHELESAVFDSKMRFFYLQEQLRTASGGENNALQLHQAIIDLRVELDVTRARLAGTAEETRRWMDAAAGLQAARDRDQLDAMELRRQSAAAIAAAEHRHAEREAIFKERMRQEREDSEAVRQHAADSVGAMEGELQRMREQSAAAAGAADQVRAAMQLAEAAARDLAVRDREIARLPPGHRGGAGGGGGAAAVAMATAATAAARQGAATLRATLVVRDRELAAVQGELARVRDAAETVASIEAEEIGELQAAAAAAEAARAAAADALERLRKENEALRGRAVELRRARRAVEDGARTAERRLLEEVAAAAARGERWRERAERWRERAEGLSDALREARREQESAVAALVEQIRSTSGQEERQLLPLPAPRSVGGGDDDNAGGGGG